MIEAFIYNELNYINILKGIILVLPFIKWYIKNLIKELS